jgi:hypothetical protein
MPAAFDGQCASELGTDEPMRLNIVRQRHEHVQKRDRFGGLRSGA